MDDASYPWSLQGSILLLSQDNGQLPNITLDELLHLLEPSTVVRRECLVALGIVGLVRPGVDGVVAGLLSTTLAQQQHLLAIMASEAAMLGFDWVVLSEEEFAERLAEPWGN